MILKLLYFLKDNQLIPCEWNVYETLLIGLALTTVYLLTIFMDLFE